VVEKGQKAEGCVINYPEPDFESAFNICRQTCTKPAECNRNGWIFYQDIYYECPLYKKHLAMKKLQDQLSQYIPETMADADFSNYHPVTKSQHHLKQIALRYFEKEAYKDGKGIIITGKNGTGKSHIAVSIYRRLVKKSVSVLFTRPRKHGSFQEIRRDFQAMEKPKVLIYDDLGTELERNFIIDMLFELIDKRLNTRKGMIMTTNIRKAELKYRLGPRIFSRLKKRHYILTVEGPDHRLENRELF